MKKYLFMVALPVCLLALALVSCSKDTSGEISKEGLWMVTYKKFVNYDLTEDKVLAQGEFTYDTDFIRGEDYTYCNIFDIQSPNEKGSCPAYIYKPKGFTSDDVMIWEKSTHSTFFHFRGISSTNDTWDDYVIVSAQKDVMVFNRENVWSDFGKKFKSVSEIVLTRIDAIPGEVVEEAE